MGAGFCGGAGGAPNTKRWNIGGGGKKGEPPQEQYRNRAASAMVLCGVEERRGKNITAIKAKKSKGIVKKKEQKGCGWGKK